VRVDPRLAPPLAPLPSGSHQQNCLSFWAGPMPQYLFAGMSRMWIASLKDESVLL